MFDVTDAGDKTSLRFTHIGLTSDQECYDACAGGWKAYMLGSLRDLITTGKGDPHRADRETAKHDAVNNSHQLLDAPA